MEEKAIIVINGRGGVGKDTLCDIIKNQRGSYGVRNISSIDKIRKIARFGGWDGNKDEKGRKLLSDIKKVFGEYNDFSFEDLMKETMLFYHSDDLIMFVHIREPEEIKKYMDGVKERYGDSIYLTSLLVKRSEIDGKTYGNDSDDGVEKFEYDFVYSNDTPLQYVEERFVNFFDNYILSHLI